jgi:type II secretory pathway component GspD/PulD (secretin)
MRHLLIAGVLVLATTAGSAAQVQTTPLAAEPITLTFFETPLEDAVTFIARFAGITIEFDATVTEEMRHVPLANHRLRLLNVTVEQALDALTSVHGLTYTITGPKAVRITKKV